MPKSFGQILQKQGFFRPSHDFIQLVHSLKHVQQTQHEIFFHYQRKTYTLPRKLFHNLVSQFIVNSLAVHIQHNVCSGFVGISIVNESISEPIATRTKQLHVIIANKNRMQEAPTNFVPSSHELKTTSTIKRRVSTKLIQPIGISRNSMIFPSLFQYLTIENSLLGFVILEAASGTRQPLQFPAFYLICIQVKIKYQLLNLQSL